MRLQVTRLMPHDLTRLTGLTRRHVSLSGSNGTQAFILVMIKSIHFDGTYYSDKERAALSRLITHYLNPDVKVIDPGDRALSFYQNDSDAGFSCIWPGEEKLYFKHAVRYRGKFTRAFAAFWGHLALAWDEIDSFERYKRVKFNTVIMVRAGLTLTSPLGYHHTYSPSAWYSAYDPPDSFWIMPRQVAAAALTTARSAIACAPFSVRSQAISAT